MASWAPWLNIIVIVIVVIVIVIVIVIVVVVVVVIVIVLLFHAYQAGGRGFEPQTGPTLRVLK